MVYLLMFPKVSKTPAKTISEQARQEPAKDVDTIFIPSANIKADISEGDINVLDKGLAWHRLPERGTPPTGGNTIITGHSFVWGTTPGEIKKKSIFYDLEKTKLGDEVTIHWDGKNYKYKVSEVKTVKPNALEIEKKTTQPTLTIYTCTLGGAADGRVVVVAKPESTN